jgi:hypothetical protein
MSGNRCETAELMPKFDFAAQKYLGHLLKKY